MRRRIALAAVSVIAAVGVGLAFASPVSAETFGFYETQADCEAAKAARGGLSPRGEPLTCRFIRETPKDRGIWHLADNRGGG